MSYLGDFSVGKTIRHKFNTFQFTGAPVTLASGAVAVYKDGGTTESTAGAGISADFDSRTGLHMVTVDTTADADFYTAGSDFDVVLTAGVADSVSQANVKLFSFSIENRTVGALPTALQQALAQTVLTRGVSHIEAQADVDSLATLILAAFHAERDGSALVIYRTNNTTVHANKTLTSSAGAAPITGVS